MDDNRALGRRYDGFIHDDYYVDLTGVGRVVCRLVVLQVDAQR